MPETVATVPGVSIPPHAREEWRLLAAVLSATGPAPCEADPESWWPANGADTGAVALCGRCRAREACAAYAVAAGEREGVWGGLLPAERRAMTRQAA